LVSVQKWGFGNDRIRGIRRNKFTAEQVEILRGNPYVRNVNEDTVSFTVEFKEEFWRLYVEEDM